ncbi:MAG: isoprenylcysteine carboxylmethyltransferase family protein [Candidatus Aminicenantales bacterium]
MTPAGIIFLIGTAAIVVFSWRFSIRARRYHGIARFFAFESILALLVLNERYWLSRPFSGNQILSWLFLFASIPPAVLGTGLLIRLGKPDGQLENTTRLVTIGIYRRIRHPLYLSIGLLGFGIFLKNVTLQTAFLAALVVLAVTLTAVVEEREMKARFGRVYEDYMKTTKRFIPWVF